MQMARSWGLPIVDDFEGALEAAAASLDGFRKLDEPFMAANAAFTLGMLEQAMGRYDAAHQHLIGVRELDGGPFGNNWLTSVARVQLASLAVRADHLDDARVLLDESLDASAGAERSTLIVTFCLVAFARLALAQGQSSQAALVLGAADGLRDRAGLRAWPLVRSDEAELLARV